MEKIDFADFGLGAELADEFGLKDDLTPPIKTAEVSSAKAFGLRPYQAEALDSIEDGWKEDGVTRQLAVLATGCGKTILFSALAAKEVGRGGRVLILAHTDELLEQAIDKLKRSTGLKAAKEKAGNYAARADKVVVASVQTLQRIRLGTWPKKHFALIIVDECHRSLAQSYQNILTHFEARVVGVTATADRGDKKALGDFYQRIAFDYGLYRAVKEGWLVRPIVKTMPVKIDLDGVQTKNTPDGSDFDRMDVAKRLSPYLEAIAGVLKKEAGDRKLILFLPSVETAILMTGYMNKAGITCDYVTGDCDNRAEKIKRYKENKVQAICNMALLCLDDKTEILTRRGFVGIDDIRDDDMVANWSADRSVFFERALEIVRRPTMPSEGMVSIDSRTINLRVTETHRMLVRHSKCNWRKIPARELQQGWSLPAFGMAPACNEKVPVESVAVSKRQISANAYALRKSGMGNAEARAEATRRAMARAELKYTQPSDLSLDDCRFIGFWVADGSRCKLASGGEYTLCQSCRYPRIIEWVDRVISGCGFDSIKRPKPAGNKGQDYFTWSLPRGTGFGPQKRNGIYRVEPYLEKNGCRYLWGLNELQFDALCEGYWMGDGRHGMAECGTPSTLRFGDTKKRWIDLLCAIGSVRGWRCAISHQRSSNPKHKDQWKLTMAKGRDITISCKTQIVREAPLTQRVWCVRTTSKNIITRRDGHVAVMGNTEGFDHDSIDSLVVLRPTKIRSLYAQMVGRGTRPLNSITAALAAAPDAKSRLDVIAKSAKPHLTIFDFLWIYKRHDLIRPASLISTDPRVVSEMAGKDGDLMEVQKQAERDLLAKLEKEIRKNANKKSRVVDPLAIATEAHDIELADYEPETARDAGPPSPGHMKILENNGVNLSAVKCYGHAKILVSRILDRHRSGLCTIKQMHFLAKLGVDASNMIKAEAYRLQQEQLKVWAERAKREVTDRLKELSAEIQAVKPEGMTDGLKEALRVSAVALTSGDVTRMRDAIKGIKDAKKAKEEQTILL